MCYLCMEDEEVCSYCDEPCGGMCGDTEKCFSCYHDYWFDDDDYDRFEECMDSGCECGCHQSFHEEMWYENEDGFERPGCFPFLQLPSEIRNEIYSLLLTDPEAKLGRKGSHFFHGKIYPAILSTCKQIHREAQHLPLEGNSLSFNNTFHALRFFTYVISDSQKQRVKSIHLEIQGPGESHSSPFIYLFKELHKLSLKHLSLSLRGAMTKEWLAGNPCLQAAIGKIVGLETFDMRIGCESMPEADKKKIVKNWKKKFTQQPDPAQSTNSLPKESTTSGGAPSSAAIPMLNKDPNVNLKTPKTTQLKISSFMESQTKRRCTTARKIDGLVEECERLKTYATAIDGGESVRIRLNSAFKAAGSGHNLKFIGLRESILSTLDAKVREQMAAKFAFENPIPSDTIHVAKRSSG